MVGSFRAAVKAARRHGDLYFAALISEEDILRAVEGARAKFQGWIYTPAVTTWAFLSQCLSTDHSCREAVARVIAWRVSRGLKPCSAETTAYCTARDHLPEEACRQLMRDTGRQTHAQPPASWLWKGRRVLLGDGSTITMPDTPENQAEYPQQPGQTPGCGFPIARILVVFSLAVGTVLEAALGPYQGKQTGENSLLRTLHATFEPGDVLVLDRYFSGWFDIALLAEQGVDVAVRKHQLRPTDFRTGRRLGRDDHLVTWRKPPRPAWMDAATYERLPDELTLREIRVRVTQKGFRTKVLILVTTLTDAEQYTHEDLADLYRHRWQAELDLRSLKITMEMDHLRCKTPHRVRNEFFMHLLAYNLIRGVMAAAAFEAGIAPRRISFKGALQTLGQFLPQLHAVVSLEAWLDALLTAIATHTVGDRPDRNEPRLRKRRPKPYKHLRRPRADYKRNCGTSR
jgi:hypothetical protein